MKPSHTLPGRLLLILVLSSSLFAGCSALSPTPAPAPTQDPATLVAAAVQTLSAQMTAEAIRNPSATPVPTDTPVPTATLVPPTETPLPPTLTPTDTATPAPALEAKFLSAGTFPENRLEYIPNEHFGLAVRFKNVGTIGWTPGYRLVLTGHEGEVTVQPELELTKGVAPGEAVEFDLWAFGSETLGRHTWYFQLFSQSGGPVPGGSAAFSYTSH